MGRYWSARTRRAVRARVDAVHRTDADRRAVPRARRSHALRGALLSFGYCIGLGIPFVAFAFFIERAARATDFIRRHYAWIMRIGGGMLVLVGLLLVTGLWLDFTIWLRVTIPGFETAL